MYAYIAIGIAYTLFRLMAEKDDGTAKGLWDTIKDLVQKQCQLQRCATCMLLSIFAIFAVALIITIWPIQLIYDLLKWIRNK